MTPDGLQAAAARLVASSGAGRAPVTLTPLPGGANNRVFAVEGADRPALLKSYFRDPGDERDRLGAEFGFSRFAWNAGLRALPEPLGSDEEAGLGLYELVEGAPVGAPEVDSEAVAAAAAFVADLVSIQDRPGAQRLPHASEACFTLEEHLARVDGRVARVAALDPADDLDRACTSFVEGTLAPAWERLRECTRATARDAGFALEDPLPQAQQCLSPSDFGFHNALRAPDRTFRFLDFEYAGWDDPAKTICDFFCQPQVPVPLSFWGVVVDRFAPQFARQAGLRARSAALLSVYRIKWCCIILNEFLRVDRDRRSFSSSGHDIDTIKKEQLAKARQLLSSFKPGSSATARVVTTL